MLSTSNIDSLSGTAPFEGASSTALVDTSEDGLGYAQSSSFDGVGSGADSTQLTFIDTGIDDYQQIADNVIAGEVVFLDSSRNGIEQITETLSQYDELTGLHIITHGDSGQLQLGNVTLDAQSLADYQQALSSWDNALTDEADVLLYGCDVAAGEHGETFVTQLSQVIGADVAASTDLTGSQILGGDWDLEFTTGTIEADASLSSAVSAYEGTLATFDELDTVRILPLGDSITRAGGEYDSYRRPLWQQLIANGYNKVDFVGSQGQIGPNAKTDFDDDNEAYGGFRADQIAANIGSWATSAQPDIVLLHLGSNDMIQGQSVDSTIDDIIDIIDTLRTINPNVAVLLAQITPSVDSRGGQQIEALGNAIPSIVNARNTAESPIILVDQRTGFSATDDTYDGLHPDQGGEIKMANRWYDALTALFNSDHQYSRFDNQPTGPNGNGDGLFAQYYNNIDFTQLATSGVDAIVDFDWGTGSPNNAIGADTFSVRWTGQVEPRFSEEYTFYTSTDDGVRLWVNGELLVDGFIDQAPTVYSGKITLEAGQKYDIRMDYYENQFGALAELSWSSASQRREVIPQSQLYSDSGNGNNDGGGDNSGGGTGQPGPNGTGDGLFVQYYNNINFTDPVVSGVDATVNFDWGQGSPNSAIGADTFSARWVGEVEPRFSERYTFYTTTDDGVRLWVNGQLLIDGFRDQAPTEYSGSIQLEAGQKYDIRMDYYENTEGAVAQLAWSSASQGKEIIPQSQLYSMAAPIVVDNPPETHQAPGSNSEGNNGQSGPNGTGDGLFVQYYNNINFTDPVVSGVDATVNFDWGQGSPNSAIGADTFSVRWVGEVEPRFTEDYTFYTTTDDGVRLWLNGQLIIDGFRDQAPTEYSSRTLRLEAGQKYDIRMDYYENGEGAVAQLAWSSASQNKEIIPQSQLYSDSITSAPAAAVTAPPQTSQQTDSSSRNSGNGLLAQYYNNINFTDQVLSRVDATVNFDWGQGSPNSAIGADTFSVRWVGEVESLFTERYTFYTTSDDGVRLWVNGQLLIDGFRDQAPTEYSGAINLVAGQKYDIRLDYYENTEGAVAQLMWSSASQAKEIIPQSQLYSA
ncbi:MAG: PA14 domain-containing protein [Phormidesmis sp.]